MIKYMFALPLALCLIWYLYLRANQYSVEQGKQGFVYIAVVSFVIVAFFSLVNLVM